VGSFALGIAGSMLCTSGWVLYADFVALVGGGLGNGTGDGGEVGAES